MPPPPIALHCPPTGRDKTWQIRSSQACGRQREARTEAQSRFVLTSQSKTASPLGTVALVGPTMLLRRRLLGCCQNTQAACTP